MAKIGFALSSTDNGAYGMNTPAYFCFDDFGAKGTEVLPEKNVDLSLIGDVNGDGSISVIDVTTLVAYIMGNSYDYFVFENADINGDGSITVTDVTSLVSLILGIEDDSND